MGNSSKNTDTLENICKNLGEYAVDREEIKVIVKSLPQDQNINTITVEYELQLLKIISTGWSIAVYMTENPQKQLFELKFWELIREFSKDISNVTNLMIGHDIDYFDLVKQRFDYYLKSFEGIETDEATTSAIGPAFAAICKDDDNPFVVITGARLFTNSVKATKEYLMAEELSH